MCPRCNQQLVLLCILRKSQQSLHRVSECRQWSSFVLGALLTACTSVAEITGTADWKENWDVTSFLSLLFLSSVCCCLVFSWWRKNMDSWKASLLLAWLGSCLLKWYVMLLVLPTLCQLIKTRGALSPVFKTDFYLNLLPTAKVYVCCLSLNMLHATITPYFAFCSKMRSCHALKQKDVCLLHKEIPFSICHLRKIRFTVLVTLTVVNVKNVWREFNN